MACPSSPQQQSQLAVPVTPGSVSGKRYAAQRHRLRSPVLRSPVRGLRTPEYTPVKHNSAGAGKKSEFEADAANEFANVGRVLFPGFTVDEDEPHRELPLPPPQQRQQQQQQRQQTNGLLQDAPALLLPPSSASKAFASILDEPLSEEDISSWQTSDPPAKISKQTPGTPSDRIVTFELARDWNNNSSSCFSSDEEDQETCIRQKTLENPFESHCVLDEETRRRRQELLLAHDPSLKDTVVYLDKKGKVTKERHLTPEEQSKFQPKKLAFR